MERPVKRTCLCVMLFSLLTHGVHSIYFIQEDVLNTSDRRILETKTDIHDNRTDAEVICKMKVDRRSISFFRGNLEMAEPTFVHFTVIFKDPHTNMTLAFNQTADTFMGDNWVWTYQTSKGLYPYLSWSIDFKVLSFGMLGTKTLKKSNFYVLINVNQSCPITLGTNKTTIAIGKAFRGLTKGLSTAQISASIYQQSSYCFLAEAPRILDTWVYFAAVYFIYPINYINYNCCTTHYDFVTNNFTVRCDDKQVEKWYQCTGLPFILSVILLFYFPIPLLGMVGWFENKEDTMHNSEGVFELSATVDYEDRAANDQPLISTKEWMYLDGESPYSFCDLLTSIWCGLDKTHQVLVSRLRRLIFLIVLPLGLYLLLLTFYFGVPRETMKASIKHRDPIGFLSILGDDSDIARSFAPKFGGPIYILATYYVVGFILLVLPSNLKQLLENGMPKKNGKLRSPLCFSVRQIRKLSGNTDISELQMDTNLFSCSICMLAGKRFWREVLKIHLERFPDGNQENCFCKVLTTPLLVITCFFESVLCVFLYGIPLVLLLTTYIRGIAVSLCQIKIRQAGCECCSTLLTRILNHPLCVLVMLALTVSVLVPFTYASSMIIVQSSTFVFSVIIYCFIAVIVFPSVAFANLFFIIIFMYNIVKIIRHFGDGYIELLSEAVKISKLLESTTNYVHCSHGNLIIYNLKSSEGVRSVRVNRRTILVAHNIMQSILSESRARDPKVKRHDEKYGIPRELFDVLIQKHRPVHQQVLHIVFRILFLATLIGATMAISKKYVTGPTSDFSDMMHVMFVVTVGAVPGLLEAKFMNVSARVKREIDQRRLGRLVIEYWLAKSNPE